jgi:two-component system CheB/CheR fusion protein
LRLPFDFLLHSLAMDFGPRAIGVILSGTGADGSLGLKTVKEQGGFIIAQDPEEPEFDGMPRSAIMTGAVDLVLRVAAIPEALIRYCRRIALARQQRAFSDTEEEGDWLSPIIALLRTRTSHDFRLYKRGTLQRRTERRMAMAAIEADDMDRYLELLRRDARELDLLVKDLLINVTSFFRDPKVFAQLARTIIPDLLRGRAPDQPLRIWIAGCSTGEETYSLAMLFSELITAAKSPIKCQFFASDVDSDAVAIAREGLYPETIGADVSPERLVRFFTRESHGYRIHPDLRQSVVFAVQDVLADPPFARLDMVSCRNLLIYLLPEAQQKVIALFHFALREGGVLLLGSAESVGDGDGRFATIAKPERLFRRIGHNRSEDLSFMTSASESPAISARRKAGQPGQRPALLADLCRQAVIETYAPAAVLINAKHECLFSLGPIDHFLKVAPGHPVQDLLAMARDGVRGKLRSALLRVGEEKARVLVSGGQFERGGVTLGFSVAAQPVASEDEELVLVSFIDEPNARRQGAGLAAAEDMPRIAEVEAELEATKAQLQAALRNVDAMNQEQKIKNEEALSINEEFQATNEELMTSKEELQSLNEELSALNSQLQQTLERSRTTSNDLKNILYSTDVATVFLDTKLNIRFFTPATRLLFNVLPGDVGRPLADLSSLAADGALLPDAWTVLETLKPIEREIKAQSGAWYVRRILPYRAAEDAVEGVVITFVDVTERKQTADALDAAKQEAQQANIAKSRFLAAASHDLRQPLQTLVLLQGMLAKIVQGEKAQKLVHRFDDTLGSISGMLNALLDINQIEAGTVHAEMATFQIDDLLQSLRSEFNYQAKAQNLQLRVVSCSLSVRTDPRLLGQMVRNLLSNALKYTRKGKVLLGCRRHGDRLSIEVWDTGIGIADNELHAIFEEYHQIDNPARERKRGLGLGLSIVQRMGVLLGHPVRVFSRLGVGSGFVIEVMLATEGPMPESARLPGGLQDDLAAPVRTGSILAIEDEPDLRDVLQLLLKDEGHRVVMAPDGPAALDLIARGVVWPDLILTDFGLPNGMDGLQLAAKLREKLHRAVPVIVLTGDISTDTLRDIAAHDCVQLNKPVQPKALMLAIERLLPLSALTGPALALLKARPAEGELAPVIYVVDDDANLRDGIRSLFEQSGCDVEDYSSCEDFLAAYRPGREGCLLIDAYLPGMKGIELLKRLREIDADHRLPAIMITGSADVGMAVEAMKAGASDFIEKPFANDELLASVERALEQSKDSTRLSAWRQSAADHVAHLTDRQREIMTLVLADHPSKNIAADLGISQRTVENHRAAIMHRMGAKSLPALARLAIAASWNGASKLIS